MTWLSSSRFLVFVQKSFSKGPLNKVIELVYCVGNLVVRSCVGHLVFRYWPHVSLLELMFPRACFLPSSFQQKFSKNTGVLRCKFVSLDPCIENLLFQKFYGYWFFPNAFVVLITKPILRPLTKALNLWKTFGLKKLALLIRPSESWISEKAKKC